MFLLESIQWIEDYYRTNSFVGIFTSKELAEQYVKSSQDKYLQNSYVSYMEYEFRGIYTELHKVELERLAAIASDTLNNKPKYKGDQRDKEALASHKERKDAWQANQNEKYGEYNSFRSLNVYDPAKIIAETYRDKPIPEELVEKVKEWKGRFPEYEIRKIPIDMVYEQRVNSQSDD